MFTLSANLKAGQAQSNDGSPHNQEMRKMKKLLLTIAILTMSISAANATILWDQSATRADLVGSWDSESPGPWGGGLIFSANDFSLGSDAVITTITTYYTDTGAWAPGTYTAHFAIYAKSGTTPITGTDDPLTALDVQVTIASIGNQVLTVTASGLGEALTAGDYWVMLSPVAPQGGFGTPEFHIYYDGAPLGDPAAWIEFGGFMPPTWTPSFDLLDGAILIEGDTAVATEATSWGHMKSLFR
jgi:hypothetical protein